MITQETKDRAWDIQVQAGVFTGFCEFVHAAICGISGTPEYVKDIFNRILPSVALITENEAKRLEQSICDFLDDEIILVDSDETQEDTQ